MSAILKRIVADEAIAIVDRRTTMHRNRSLLVVPPLPLLYDPAEDDAWDEDMVSGFEDTRPNVPVPGVSGFFATVVGELEDAFEDETRPFIRRPA